MAMSPEELQALSSKVASEVLQRISQTLSGGAQPARAFVFKCPGDFGCDALYHCTQSFQTLQAAE
jgi:hypothetical protein